MIREIKFRGISVQDGILVYGSLLNAIDGSFIIDDIKVFNEPTLVNNTSYACEVDSKTLGQFTGLTDKNGKEIYEGDIFLNEHNEECGTVDFYDGSFWIHWGSIAVLLSEENLYFTIIGNIHENPELI